MLVGQNRSVLWGLQVALRHYPAWKGAEKPLVGQEPTPEVQEEIFVGFFFFFPSFMFPFPFYPFKLVVSCVCQNFLPGGGQGGMQSKSGTFCAFFPPKVKNLEIE